MDVSACGIYWDELAPQLFWPPCPVEGTGATFHWLTGVFDCCHHWQLAVGGVQPGVSKSGRTRLRKMFHNLRKILAFEHKTVKNTSFNLILLISMQFFSVFGLSGTFSCAIFFGWTFYLHNENCFQKVWYSLQDVIYQCIFLCYKVIQVWGHFFSQFASTDFKFGLDLVHRITRPAHSKTGYTFFLLLFI